MTYESADSERYVAEALSDGSYDTIVAAGGDGSINEVMLRARLGVMLKA